MKLLRFSFSSSKYGARMRGIIEIDVDDNNRCVRFALFHNFDEPSRAGIIAEFPFPRR